MWPIFKILMPFYQAKANLDDEILFGKIPKINNIKTNLQRVCMGIENSTFLSGP